MDWITGIQAAINYIEDHLTEELDYELIAGESFSSSSHFQRIFSILCGYTLGEYIRNRRLTLAGTELASGKEKVIDIALKYGYDSPDSFTKAFQKFHGITPSQVRSNGNLLRSFSRLSIKISLEGGTMMNYRIETKPEMKLLGYKRHFSGAPFGDARYEQEKNFFMTTRAHQWMQAGITNNKLSAYCILTNFTDEGYDFCRAVSLDGYETEHLYNQNVTGINFMDQFNFEFVTIPAGTYAVFETKKQRNPINEYFEIRKRIVSEWLVSSKYVVANGPEIAVYHWPIKGIISEGSIEIWLPIVAK